MSLYSIFLIRSWLSLYCSTEEVNRHFRKALKEHNYSMTMLALAELIKRGRIDLATHATQEKPMPDIVFPAHGPRLF